MAVTDILKSNKHTQREITCPRYDPLPDGRRCWHYLDTGACSHPDELMCVEWLRVNDHPAPEDTTLKPVKVLTDLFGNPVPEDKLPKTAARKRPRSATLRPRVRPVEPGPPPRGLTTEDIKGFKARGLEICIESDVGQIWLVPEYTGGHRKELTPEHAATLCHVREAFPGARITSFERVPKTEEEVEG